MRRQPQGEKRSAAGATLREVPRGHILGIGTRPTRSYSSHDGLVTTMIDRISEPPDGGQAPAGSVRQGNPISVLIIDDSCLHREGLTDFLQRLDCYGTVLTDAHAKPPLR